MENNGLLSVLELIEAEAEKIACAQGDIAANKPAFRLTRGVVLFQPVIHFLSIFYFSDWFDFQLLFSFAVGAVDRVNDNCACKTNCSSFNLLADI